jgi:acetolactate synthase-1/2/3 large subunit
MQRMTGGQAVASALKVEGIEHVFGIVGTHASPLFDGVFDDPSIRVVTVRHEQGASLMAAGYARASGKIAACFVVPGPGLTNALTGIGMAYSESAPLLVFGGQNTLAQLEREGGHFHELANSVNVARSVCGYATRVSSPGEIPKVIREAMRAMRCQRPRPAYIEIPLDVQSGEADVALLPPEEYSRPSGDPASITRAAEALKSSKRPFIFAGGGVASAEATQPLGRVAELLGAPVVTSVFGRGRSRTGIRSHWATAGAGSISTTSCSRRRISRWWLDRASTWFRTGISVRAFHSGCCKWTSIRWWSDTGGR